MGAVQVNFGVLVALFVSFAVSLIPVALLLQLPISRVASGNGLAFFYFMSTPLLRQLLADV